VGLVVYVAAILVLLLLQTRTRRTLEKDVEMQGGSATPPRPPSPVDVAGMVSGLKYLAGILLVLAYAWVCDRGGEAFGLTRRSKSFEEAIALVATGAVVLPYLASFESQGKGAGFLGTGQTDEWKGWMQIFLVFYHYLFPSPQPLAIYVTARIVVASFLFMTGYGRTMSAIKRASSFSFYTLCSMMIRLNLFVVLLAAAMGRQFCDYYFSPLVTLWSVFFYALHTLGRCLRGSDCSPTTR
jgi:hypothetical protein